jgi:putative transposase
MAGQRLFDSFDAEVYLECDRHAPGQHPAGEPVQDGGEIGEPSGHGDVGDVHRPDLTGPGHCQFSQQTGVDLAARGDFRSVWLAIQGFDARFRDELLNGEIYNTLREAQILIERWRRHYNTVKPHSALGYRPPASESIVTIDQRPTMH